MQWRGVLCATNVVLKNQTTWTQLGMVILYAEKRTYRRGNWKIVTPQVSILRNHICNYISIEWISASLGSITPSGSITETYIEQSLGNVVIKLTFANWFNLNFLKKLNLLYSVTSCLLCWHTKQGHLGALTWNFLLLFIFLTSVNSKCKDKSRFINSIFYSINIYAIICNDTSSPASLPYALDPSIKVHSQDHYSQLYCLDMRKPERECD